MSAETAVPAREAASATRERRGAGARARLAGLGASGWLTLVGGILLPVGLALIGLGWYGASHTPFPFEQTSYLISGGLGGLGVVMVGGFLYFAGWLSRLVAVQQQESARLVAVLREHPGGPPAGPATTGPAAGLVATANGTMVHRADCPVVAGREGLRAVTAGAPGLRACRLCNPRVA